MRLGCFRGLQSLASLATVLLLCVSCPRTDAQMARSAAPSSPSGLAAARRELAARHYARAKELYRAYLRTHPDSIDAQLGVADTELALHEYEAAEIDYRRI